MFHEFAEYFPKKNHLRDCLEIINNKAAPIAWKMGCKDAYFFEDSDHSRILIHGIWNSQAEFDSFVREITNRGLEDKIMNFCTRRSTHMISLPTPKRKAA